ncbi:tryptophan synthase subunit alpha [Methermicoccus shengliensis]|uniref:Tryptophan synthase alpha chain n=1 Tax=Methermicoccus shengliensis TaxID=660064 RepID=A0A832RVS9_9EURY|nr:tryptophan synthase subunit alpha [Methermicoccus shengliensis]KUK04705.1 MAG: Tryptophan synthase alpha chain [Euryarchaeota archaeon 55_53]KUK30528.1 MAG: Tryptophan synthase alpha chain [Methanosarcinales archeaon 56_1174]MDI3487435.1 tryptophan synthase alpha chain [Methanosarcinales archaeon]MDN5295236.1 tryptophan synthase alpha chain [Methanosarcinales archaeon]HIH69675.1 tryptophan synthase subunit alpha [Methermicoccus shengliensis]
MGLEKGFSDGAALVAYVCAGDPSLEATPHVVKRLERGGADIIELGLPFSDPIADGKVIQEASQRALARGMNPDVFFEMVSSLDVDVPLVVMTYYNLLLRGGVHAFVERCALSGISAIVVPDLPIEEADELRRACAQNGVGYVGFAAPTTPHERLRRILDACTAFLYIVSRLGTTGVGGGVSERVERMLKGVSGTSVPKVVGFGISTPEEAERLVALGADGVVVGSHFVRLAAQGRLDDIEREARAIKQGCLAGKRGRAHD